MQKRNGVKEWIFQRFSNLLIIAWIIVYVSMIVTNNPLTYESWVSMHSEMWFKIYTTVTLVFATLNSLLAGWQIGTDYTQKVPMAGFDKIYSVLYVVPTILYFVAGIYIFWWIV